MNDDTTTQASAGGKRPAKRALAFLLLGMALMAAGIVLLFVDGLLPVGWMLIGGGAIWMIIGLSGAGSGGGAGGARASSRQDRAGASSNPAMASDTSAQHRSNTDGADFMNFGLGSD